MRTPLPCVFWCSCGVALSACGAPANGDAGMTVALPLPMPLTTCPERTAVGAALSAQLEVGGYDAPCELSIDAATLVATGACPDITVGIVRPVGLRYSYEDGGNASIALGYLLGFVDLRPETLAGAAEVTLDLDPTAGAAKLLTLNADVEALRLRSACVELSEVEVNLCVAEAWAKNRFDNEAQIDFDRDEDGENNIVEACNGTLLP